PQSGERQIHFVDDDKEIGDVDLEIPRELANRLTAVVHERQRLDEEQRLRLSDLRDQRVGGRGLEGRLPPPALSAETGKPIVVPRAPILLAGFAQPDVRLQASLPPSLSSSFFPFLMPSAPAGAAAAAPAAASAGAATSSTFGMMTWASINSA